MRNIYLKLTPSFFPHCIPARTKKTPHRARVCHVKAVPLLRYLTGSVFCGVTASMRLFISGSKSSCRAAPKLSRQAFFLLSDVRRQTRSCAAKSESNSICSHVPATVASTSSMLARTHIRPHRSAGDISRQRCTTSLRSASRFCAGIRSV